MALLSLILAVCSIFVGGAKGIALWVIGTFVLIFLAGGRTLVFEGRGIPILIISVGIQVVAILISRWWGLLFHLVASFALIGCIAIGLL